MTTSLATDPVATLHETSAPPQATLPPEPDRAPVTVAGTGTSRQRRTEATARVLAQAAAADDPAEKSRLVDEAVLLNLGVARAIASRYRGRGLDQDDLEQVACLALTKAAHRFDPSREHDFLSFAVPTIRGEVKKHFRDQGWTVRPPRRVQELQTRIMVAADELGHRLGRSPRASEIAAHLDEPVEDVTDALSADGCFAPASLDRPIGESGETCLGDLLGEADPGRDAAEARLMLGPVVRRLGDRDRRILTLRFFHGWTQEEIARDIGVTQMQVSRLLARILSQLREMLGVDIRAAA